MSILSEIGAWLLGIGEGTLNFFKAAIMSLASNPQLQSIAMDAVVGAENLAISGVEKQANAYSTVAGQLASAGLPVIASQINLAIEAAVATLKTTNTAGNAAGSQTQGAQSAAGASAGSQSSADLGAGTAGAPTPNSAS